MKRQLLFIVLTGLTFITQGQVEKAREILNKVNEENNKISTLQYDYAYEGWGKTYGKFKGYVILDKRQGLRLMVNLNTVDIDGDTLNTEYIFTNGDSIRLTDLGTKSVKAGRASNGSGHLMSYAWYAVFREFLMHDAFANVKDDESLSYDGNIVINGTDCHVISMNNLWGDRISWYFGKADNRIHGQLQRNDKPETEGGFEFSMSQLKINDPIDDSAFNPSINDFNIINEDKRIVGVGETAPEWMLKNGAGEPVSNRQFKGSIVLLDFWASWCSPCWQIMPVINSIKRDYETKDLVVFGVNVWENPKLDVSDYLKRKGLNHYEILFDSEASVAKSFKIGALPLVVLVGKDGKILYHNNGRDEKMDGTLREILDKEL